jgi:hypothetical protein
MARISNGGNGAFSGKAGSFIGSIAVSRIIMEGREF